MQYTNRLSKLFIAILLLLCTFYSYCQQQENTISDYYKSPVSSNVAFSFAQLTDIHISVNKL